MTLLSSVMRVGSVYMREMDVYVYGVDLVSVIFRTAFVHDTQATPQASWCGGTSVTTRGQGKVNSARYIAQVVNSVLPSLLQQMKCFFSRTTHVHIRLL